MTDDVHSDETGGNTNNARQPGADSAPAAPADSAPAAPAEPASSQPVDSAPEQPADETDSAPDSAPHPATETSIAGSIAVTESAVTESAVAESASAESAVAGNADTAGVTKPAKRRRGRFARIVIWSLATLIVLALVAAVTGVWEVRRAFPQYDGALRLPGLSAPVTVYRDKYAIPQLFASNTDDLFKAQGYVAAQERFWEMDFRRHVTSGRLSEMFGSDQVDTDSYLRTMGWRRIAEQEWSIISPQSRQYLTDYADGVNAYLKGNSAGAISLEYTVLGLQNSSYTIAPWDPIDSLAWLKALAFDLRGNMDDEITRATLLGSGLTRAQVESLYPAYPFDQNRPIIDTGTVKDGTFTTDITPPVRVASSATTGVPAGAPDVPAVDGRVPAIDIPAGALPALAAVRAAIDGIPSLVGENFPGIGSNSWVISGSLTTTGKPILANDPHLSPTMPGIWYQMGLHCVSSTPSACPFNVEGYTFSGVPGVIIGHNARVSWGFTNLNPDVTDLYLEKIKGNQYEVDGQWRDLTLRTETIKVAGGKPVALTIRTTNNGPLLSDASADLRTIASKPDVDPSGKPVDAPVSTSGTGEAGVSYAVALRWTALDPGKTIDALFAIDTASNWTDFRAAAALFEVPAQNMIYADVDGNIGYQSPGRIPVRTTGDGRWPAPGWDSAYDWTSYIPFNELPNELNPRRGYIVTANQAVINPDTYQPFLTDDWTYGYRSQSIVNMIDAVISGGAKISPADVASMQFDNRNGFAAQIVPTVLGEQVTGQTAKAQALLRDWNFQEPADGADGSTAAKSSAAAAYFNAFWRNLVFKTFDEVPQAQLPDGYDRWFVVMVNLLQDPTNAWWDNRSTPQVETCDDIVKAAMSAASAELTKSQGNQPSSWRWGAMHTLVLRNQSLGESGIGVIEWLFNYGPVGVSGGNDVVNATGTTLRNGYFVDSAPSMRMIVDMSNLDASRWVQLTGESGHAFSSHYRDQFDLWRTGQTLPMRWDEATIASEAKDTLTLLP